MPLSFLDFEQPIAELEAKIDELKFVSSDAEVNIGEEIARLRAKSRALTSSIFASLTPWQVLDQLGRILLIDVEFQLRDGRWLCLPRITQPEPAQALLLSQIGWTMPVQPPPRIRSNQIQSTDA